MDSVRGWVAAFALVAIILADPTTVSATHTDFHGYSIARENSRGNTYVGVSVTRPENNPGNLPADGCSQFFSGHPVYQTQWVVLSGRYRWIEFGNWNVAGVAEAGLESYQPSAAVGKHLYGALQFRRNDAWHRFDGQDQSSVTPRPTMCGTWSTTPSNSEWFWYASQNRTC